MSPGDRASFQFGVTALGLSLIAAACLAWDGSPTGGGGVRRGCCLGLLPWLMSAPLAAVVATRDSPGRPWALLALLVDLLLLGLLLVVARSGT